MIHVLIIKQHIFIARLITRKKIQGVTTLPVIDIVKLFIYLSAKTAPYLYMAARNSRKGILQSKNTLGCYDKAIMKKDTSCPYTAEVYNGGEHARIS